MNLFKKIFLFAICLFGLPLASALAYDFSSERASVYTMWKENYVENYYGYPAYGLVFDPDSDGDLSNDEAVSEGVGYGLLIATMQNDQATFDKIFQAAETWMWNGKTYDWQIATDGTKLGTNGATDADEDIAMALIIADAKQKKGEWTATKTYGIKAQILINNLYDNNTTSEGYLKPGDAFGGADELNLSYFSPAWYRVFDKYEKKHHNWKKIIAVQYNLIKQISKNNNSLIPDWCTANGAAVSGRSYDMSYDSIRIPWRLALDAQLNKEKKAGNYLKIFMHFIENNGATTDAKMYSLDGAEIEYHNELVVAMYAAGAIGAKSKLINTNSYIAEFKNFYDADQQAFGTWDEAYLSYYNQSLALLAAGFIDQSFKIR